MPIFPSVCEFTPAGSDLSNATLGWDAVYAVRYSTLNQALLATANPPPPWTQPAPPALDGATPQGTLQAPAEISGIKIVPGGHGETLRWLLEARVNAFDGTASGLPNINMPFRLDIQMDTQLRIIEDATQPGLLHVHVHTANVGQTDTGYSAPIIRSVKINPADVSAAGLTAIQRLALESALSTIITARLPAHYPVLFDAIPLSSILTEDFSKQVEIPWLRPTLYRAAAADLPASPADGILAVLMMADDAPADGVAVEVSGLAFPVNPDVNAAVVIKSELLARSTLLTQLNQELKDTALSTFKELDDEPGVLANEKEISLYYRLDAMTSQPVLVPGKAAAFTPGTITYPATVAPGALRFEIAEGAITADMTEIRVKLPGGNTLVLSMRSRFGLVVNPDTQEIDITLQGTPRVTSHFEAGRDEGWVTWLQYGAIAASIALGEAITFLGDHFLGGYTNLRDANLEKHLNNYFAALRQSEAEGQAVSFDIGLQRTMIVEYRDHAPGGRIQRPRTAPPAKLKPEYLNVLKLNQKYPEHQANLNTEMETLVPPTAHRGGQGPRPAPFSRERVLAGDNIALKAEWLISDVLYLTRADVTLQQELKTECRNLRPTAEQGALLAEAIEGIRTGGNISHGTSTHLSELSQFQNMAASAYEGTAICMDRWLKAGKITVTEYHLILEQYPEFAKDANLAKRAGARFRDGRTQLHVETRAWQRETAHPAPMLLAQFQDAENMVKFSHGRSTARGNAALNRALMRQIMLDDKRPFWLHAAGVAGYLGMLLVSYFAGEHLGRVLPSPENSQEDDKKGSKLVTDAIARAPSAMIFNAVTFPLMVRHQTNGVVDPTVPPPSSVLKRAAINGGLVLGVSIT